MARKKQYQDLHVFMNGKIVGILTRESTGQLSFQYHDEWLQWNDSRPISLSMPLTEIPYKGNHVENYFDNLLPDNEFIIDRIQTRFGIPSKNCFDLLSYIGGDCIGALQLLPTTKAINVKKINASPINNKSIATLLKKYKSAPLGMDKESDFRISIAGAQEKTALLLYKNKWHLPLGTTPTSHIIKLPIGEIKHSGIDLSDSVENEWLCLQILSAYQLPVNRAEIMQFDDMKTLSVERFDRRWATDKSWLMRLPQEDFCQALGKSSALKYESDGGPGIQDIMKLLLGAQNANEDRKKFMKSVFLFWVLGAIDGHAKNFSLHIEPQGRFQLTPLYDVISAYPIIAKHQMEKQKIKMAMSLKGKNRHYLWSAIQLRHWFSMAELCQFSSDQMQKIIDDVCDNMEDVITTVTDKLPPHFPTDISKAIFSGMREIRDRCQLSDASTHQK